MMASTSSFERASNSSFAGAVELIVAGHAFVGEPLHARFGLYDAAVAADGHAIERRRVALRERIVAGLGVDVVVFGALRVRGIQQLFGALGRVGDVGHKVDFAGLKLVHKLGERAGNVFVIPRGRVVRKGLQVFVTPARLVFAGHAALKILGCSAASRRARFARRWFRRRTWRYFGRRVRGVAFRGSGFAVVERFADGGGGFAGGGESLACVHVCGLRRAGGGGNACERQQRAQKQRDCAVCGRCRVARSWQKRPFSSGFNLVRF